MVEGLAGTEDVLNHPFQIAKNFPRWNPQRPIPLTQKPRIARFITCRISAATMRFAIHFDRQPRLHADKIQHVRPSRMLSPELVSRRTCSQLAPQ